MQNPESRPESRAGKWLNAQTLNERLAALRHNTQALASFDKDKAEARLASWKNIRAFQKNESWLASRLQMADCSPEEFLHILGIPASEIFVPDYQPDWLSEFFASENAPELQFKSQALDSARTRGLLSAFLPFIGFYADRLYQAIQARQDIPDCTRLPAEKLLDLFLSPLLPQIQFITQRACALEINIQRLLGQLSGSTPEERYMSFAHKMEESDSRLAFLSKYPVLVRRLQKMLSLWLEASLEFLERFASDITEIRSFFGINQTDSLALFNPSGDTHCHGRSVVIVSFQSGKKILYKPHSLSIDRHFQELLDWCNKQGFDPPLKNISVLDKGSYGWVEFIENHPCKNNSEIEEFYKRLGTILALFYALGTTDVHFENLIAAGPDPVVIDLETLFQSQIPEDVATATEFDLQKLRKSVMRIGLLPVPETSEDNKAFDVSGIGASAGQKSPYKVSYLLNIGKDDMHIDHLPGIIDKVHNRPTEDAEIDVPVQHLLNGFISGIRVLIKNKEALLAPAGPLSIFSQDTGRMVVRATRIYGSLAMDAAHPDLLRDDLDRTMHWDNLWNDNLILPVLQNCIPSEMQQVQEGDIPFFSMKLDSTTLIGSDGTHIDSAMKQSGLANAQERIANLSEDVLAQQGWFIRASLGYLEGYQRKPRRQTKEISSTGSLSPYLSAACDAGNEIVDQLTFHNGTASCLYVNCLTNPTAGEKPAYAIAPSKPDLYDGLSGIALFLAYLGRESKNETYQQAAAALLKSVQAEKSRQKLKDPGVFSGLGSLVYLYLHLSQLWDRQELLTEAEALIAEITPLIETDAAFDIIAGSAGCLLALLSLARRRPEGNALKTARICGDQLLDKCRGLDADWKALPIQRGFAHGLAGIAYALLALGKFTGEEKYARAALEAIELERRLISGGNWTDSQVASGRFHLAWCHGATGIALCRLGIYRLQPDPGIVQDVEQTLKICAEHYRMESQCLCHGSLGNLEPLLIASRQFPEFGHRFDFIDQAAKDILVEIENNGWKSLLPSQTLSHGLMTGVAGIGYAFLRLHNPGGIPSVLALEGPVWNF